MVLLLTSSKKTAKGYITKSERVFFEQYRDRQIHKPQVLRKWGEKVAFFCLLQAGERKFLFSYPRNLGFVDLPIPVIKTFFARLKKVNTRALDQESSLLGSDASDGLVQFSCFEIKMCTH